MKQHKNKILIGVVGIIFMGIIFWIKRDNNVQAGPLDNFAQCLSDKGLVMYGADWCPHCQTQKNMFGKSFKNINYVECPQDPKKCLAAGIGGYPTWIVNGEKLVGEQKLENLSRAGGCPLPINF